MYHLILLTDFVPPQHYGLIGNSAICLIIANIALNLLVTATKILPQVHKLIRRLKLRANLWRMRRFIKIRQKSLNLACTRNELLEQNIVVEM